MFAIPRIDRHIACSFALALALVACSNGDDGDDDGVASSPAADGDDDAGGDDATDNVAACQDLKSSFMCGGVDYGAQIDCSAYEGLTCDVSPYLECLDDNFECQGDTFDATAWMGCSTQLQELLADC